MNMIRAIMLGAGNRGLGTYGAYALKHKAEISFVAIAETDPGRRTYFAMQHNIDLSMQFQQAADVFKEKKFADAVFVCTQDQQHTEYVLKAFRLGYHVFLEKPMATKPRDVLRILKQQKLYHRKLVIAHVLRFSPFFMKIKKLMEDKVIGDIMGIDHIEQVGDIHYSHSYVRGNWRNSQLSSPMILAKSCHDMDILLYLIGEKPQAIASFGELTHFKADTMKDVPGYCMDGCPHQESCRYEARKIYLHAADWMKYPVSNDFSEEAMLKALRKGPYGRCVYRSDNNVVDHQTVTMQFEKGISVNFMMMAFTKEIKRTIHIMGTKGELLADMNQPDIQIIPFGKEPYKVHVNIQEGGHGGGDDGVMKKFIHSLTYDWDTTLDVEDAVMAHLMAFAAEESRVSGKIIDMKHYIEEIERGTKTSETR
jgi:predicted dehydrogenase